MTCQRMSGRSSVLVWFGRKKIHFRRKQEKKKSFTRRKATTRRFLSCGSTKVKRSFNPVIFSIKVCFHLLCCLLRVGERVFDRFVKSYEIRVTCNFGENSIFFSIVLGSSLKPFQSKSFLFSIELKD